MNKLKIAQQNRSQRMKNIVESVPTYKKDHDKSGFTTLKDSSKKIEDSVRKVEGGSIGFKNGNGPAM